MIGFNLKNKRALYYTFVLQLLALASDCQQSFGVSLETRSGFEYNVFNANEDRVVLRNGIEQSALQSAFFQRVQAGISWGIKSNGLNLIIFKINCVLSYQ